MEEDVSDKKNYKSENNDEEKELEFLDDTSPDKMEEGVSDKKMTRVKIMMRKQRLNA